jgi:hypothetical protein
MIGARKPNPEVPGRAAGAVGRSGRAQKEKAPALTLGFLPPDTTSPRRADPCGATERAPESSGSNFWKRCLSTLRCRESRC